MVAAAGHVAPVRCWPADLGWQQRGSCSCGAAARHSHLEATGAGRRRCGCPAAARLARGSPAGPSCPRTNRTGPVVAASVAQEVRRARRAALEIGPACMAQHAGPWELAAPPPPTCARTSARGTSHTAFTSSNEMVMWSSPREASLVRLTTVRLQVFHMSTRTGATNVFCVLHTPSFRCCTTVRPSTRKTSSPPAAGGGGGGAACWGDACARGRPKNTGRVPPAAPAGAHDRPRRPDVQHKRRIRGPCRCSGTDLRGREWRAAGAGWHQTCPLCDLPTSTQGW
jgi:hypothetical protein